MRLEFGALTLQDFKSFNGTHTIDLRRPPGVYLVMGDNRAQPTLGANGAGKSTLWDALVWVIENRTVRSARSGNSIEPWGGGAPVVELNFAVDGIDHSVLRRRRPNQLTMHDKPVDDAEVINALGISGEALRRSVIFGQFGESFLDLRPEQKSKMLSDVLGLDRWLRAAERARQVAASDEALAAQRENEVDALKQRIDDHRAQVADARAMQAQEARRQSQAIAKAEQAAALAGKAYRLAQQQAARTLKGIALATPTAAPAPDDLEGVSELLRALWVKASNAAASSRTELQAVTRLLAEYRRAPGTCPECGQPVKKPQAARRIAELESSLAELTLELDRHNEAVDETNEKLNALRPVLDALNHAADECDRAEGELKQAKAPASSLDGVIKGLESKLATLKKQVPPLEAEAVRLHETAQAAQFWVDGFKQIRLGLLESVLADMELACNRIAESLGLEGWAIRFQTERLTQAGNVSLGFTTLLYPPGQESPEPWEAYSGGESQRWQLAATFALSEVLLAHAGIEPNIEVLDEPLRHLSEQGIDDVLAYLQERAALLGRAIYLTEHRVLDAGAFDGSLVVIKDAEGSYLEAA
jgi:DNA repair exonuclease SbcCD ATPase subunit